MGKRSTRVLICALIAVGSGIAGLLLSNVHFFQVVNAKTYDAHFVARDLLSGPQSTSNIVLITADQKALDTFPEVQLFWHEHYANAIRGAGMGGAKAMALDLAFGIPVEKWEPGLDQKLADAVFSAPMPVVVAYVAAFNANPQSANIPLNVGVAGLGLDGYPNLTTDEVDDFIRRQELLSNDTPPAPSLALRVAEKSTGRDFTYEKGVLKLAGQPVPIDADRAIYINYSGGPGTFPSHSMADVEAAVLAKNTGQLKEWFDGKIVLLGTDFIGDSDRRSTPFFTPWSGEQWTTAGVEIHANTVRTLLERVHFTPAPQWLRMGSILAATTATIIAVIVVSAAATIPALLAIGVIVAFLTHVLFRYGVILSTSEIMTSATLCLIGAIIYRYTTEERRGDLFHQAVSLFVGKRVAASLEDTRSLGLTGKRQDVTILFTDIRGFTAYTEQVCEEQGPEFLVQKLNEYMGTMAAIIVSFGGHVNKYIGDGILAVFADDDEGAKPGDHPLRAVQCATRMVNAPSEFRTGAGLHTGLAVVGNVGSADKMEYTVLGDTVNLASRLESLNKEHKTKLLMSETTQQALSGSIQTTHLGSVAVRGKAAPINLFTVTALIVPSSDAPKEVSHA